MDAPVNLLMYDAAGRRIKVSDKFGSVLPNTRFGDGNHVKV